MEEPFDVVTVPDFGGKSRGVFEVRTLFFLASWIENAGRAARHPLHLACIGDPPRSVCAMAERVGAAISVHKPIRIREGHHVGNKLRGLEVAAETDQILLLDADTFILGDLSPLGRLRGTLAAAPSARPRIPEATWQEIYPVFGLGLPQERIRCLGGELAVLKKRERIAWQDRERNRMVPYYNSGVLLVPRNCLLRPLWEHGIRQIAAAVPEEGGVNKVIHLSDQAGLAVALQMLRNRGLPFERLAGRFHVTWRHLYAGQVDVGDSVIYHACGFMRAMGNEVTRSRVAAGLNEYCLRKTRTMFREAAWIEFTQLNCFRGIRRYAHGSGQARQLLRVLSGLHDRHVAPLLRSCGQ